MINRSLQAGTYKDRTGGRVGLDLAVREGTPGHGEVGGETTCRTITSIATQVTVSPQRLTRAVAHLRGQH